MQNRKGLRNFFLFDVLESLCEKFEIILVFQNPSSPRKFSLSKKELSLAWDSLFDDVNKDFSNKPDFWILLRLFFNPCCWRFTNELATKFLMFWRGFRPSKLVLVLRPKFIAGACGLLIGLDEMNLALFGLHTVEFRVWKPPLKAEFPLKYI